MKLLLISDAHSNPLALRAILTREGGADMDETAARISAQYSINVELED